MIQTKIQVLLEVALNLNNQPTNQPTNQPINQSTNQPINQSTNQPTQPTFSKKTSGIFLSTHPKKGQQNSSTKTGHLPFLHQGMWNHLGARRGEVAMGFCFVPQLGLRGKKNNGILVGRNV